MRAPEIVLDRRTGDESALALLANDELLANKVSHGLAQRDAAHPEATGERALRLQPVPRLQPAAADFLLEMARKLAIERLGARATQHHLGRPLGVHGRYASGVDMMVSHHKTSYQGRNLAPRQFGDPHAPLDLSSRAHGLGHD